MSSSFPFDRGRIPVLVVGGGPVGAALAVDLAHRGHPPVVIERLEQVPADHPRGANNSMRTVEHYRRWGIAERLKERQIVVTLEDGTRHIPALGTTTTFATSLFGDVLGNFTLDYGRVKEQHHDISAEPNVSAPQSRANRLLRERAEELGARFVYDYEATGAENRDDHVIVHLRNLASGEEISVEADYVVGCDGGRGVIRKSAGIEREGHGDTSVATCIVRLEEGNNAKILQRMRYRIQGFLLIANPGVFSITVPFDDKSWRFSLHPDKDGNLPDKDGALRTARAVFGDDTPVEILTITPFRRQIRIARQYRQGRIFIAGDSAHLFPPTGGQNQNTGIGDAVNLAWKLTGVLEGWASPAILDSYDAERRPLAWRVAETAFGISARWPELSEKIREFGSLEGDDQETLEKRRQLGEILYEGTYDEWVTKGLVLDIRYEDSPLIVSDGSIAPEWHQTRYAPVARPGHRAPHAWLADGSPLYDSFGPAFTLLQTDPALSDTAEAFRAAAAAAGIPLTIFETREPHIRTLYDAPLVLVRPDQQVAWRGGEHDDPASILAIATGHGPASSASNTWQYQGAAE